MRVCYKCKTEKQLSEFRKDVNRKNGIGYLCISCSLNYCRNYQNINREKLNEKAAKYRVENREKFLAALNKYRENNKELFAKAQRERRKRPEVRLFCAISAGMRTSLKGKKNSKHWESLVGYTKNDLMKRLKSTLPDGISWDDYVTGKVQLHIDHIIPVSVFNYKTPEDFDFKRCWSLNNLRLLPAKENMEKRTYLKHPFQPSLSGL